MSVTANPPVPAPIPLVPAWLPILEAGGLNVPRRSDQVITLMTCKQALSTGSNHHNHPRMT
jgi:hypothetical protein